MQNYLKIYNRRNKTLENELIFKESSLKFLYSTKTGNLLRDILIVRIIVSVLYGYFMKLPCSQKKIISFINKYSINPDEFDLQINKFKSFNDFFIRKLKPEMRPFSDVPDELASPVDARLTVISIKPDTHLFIKKNKFSLYDFIGIKEANLFAGGICLQFRLNPADYHRFHYFDNGVHDAIKTIPGILHSVNPLALNSVADIYLKNRRNFTVLQTVHFGTVIQAEIGAMLVGRIHQHFPKGTQFVRGEEKGYFEFGGSTILLFFKKNSITIDEDILKYSDMGIETLVLCGMKIGNSLLV